jgi:hypothetical protein
MTLLNRTGDVTIGWTDDNHDAMVEMIREKMAQGFTFFVVRGEDHVRLRKIEDIGTEREVVLDDSHAEALFKAGKIGLVERLRTAASDTIDTIRRAITPEDAATTNTVAIRPMRGG